MPADQGTLETDVTPYIHPLGDKVLVKPIETPDEVNVGGIKLLRPEEAKAQFPAEGTILELGPDCPRVAGVKEGESLPMLEVGTRVVYSKYAGIMLNMRGGGRLLLIPFQDFLGYMDKEAPGLEEKPVSWTPR